MHKHEAGSSTNVSEQIDAAQLEAGRKMVTQADATIDATEAAIHSQLGIDSTTVQGASLRNEGLGVVAQQTLLDRPMSAEAQNAVDAVVIETVEERLGMRSQGAVSPLMIVETTPGGANSVTKAVAALAENNVMVAGHEAAVIAAEEVDRVAREGDLTGQVEFRPSPSPEKAPPGSLGAITHSLQLKLEEWEARPHTTGVQLTKVEKQPTKDTSGAFELNSSIHTEMLNITSVLSSGEGYTGHDVAALLELGYRTKRVAQKALGELMPANEQQAGYDLQTQHDELRRYLEETVPMILADIPVRKLTAEVLPQIGEGVVGRHMQDMIAMLDQHGVPAGRKPLCQLQAKRYGFDDSMQYYGYLAAKSAPTTAERTTLSHAENFLPYAHEIEGTSLDTGEQLLDKQQRTHTFLKEVIGLTSEHVSQFTWAHRHDKRSVHAGMNTLSVLKDQYQFTPDEFSRLFNDAGLVEVARYEPLQLLNMNKFLEGDLAFIDHLKSGEVTVCISDRTSDHNNAFKNIGKQFGTPEGRDLFFEIDDTEEGMATLATINQLLRQHDIHPSRLVLGAHGGKDQTMEFGLSVLRADEIAKKQGVWSEETELDRLFATCKPREDEPALIFLLSCSQGGMNENGVSMGATLAERAGQGFEVAASPIPTNVTRAEDGTLTFIDTDTHVFRAGSQGVEKEVVPSITYTTPKETEKAA